MSRSRFQLQQQALQARLFESIPRRRIDAKAFIAAFMTSKVAEGLDARYDRLQWMGEEYLFQEVMEESGLKRTTHPRHYDPEALFYAGYIYRYWHYLTGESSREIYAQANEDEILASYGLHTEDNRLAVEDLKRLAAERRSIGSAV